MNDSEPWITKERFVQAENLIKETMEINGYEPIEALNVMTHILVKSFLEYGSREDIVKLGGCMLIMFDAYIKQKNES